MKATEETRRRWPLWEVSFIYPGAGTIVTFQVRERNRWKAEDDALGLFTAKLETHTKRVKAPVRRNEEATKE